MAEVVAVRDDQVMSSPHRSTRRRPIAQVPLLSLVPWAALLGATVITERFVPYRSMEWSRFGGAALGYLGFVALPAALPLAAALPGRARWVVLACMTAVATYAGVQMVVVDDAQAGLAVLWVPFVAIPMAVGSCVTRVVMNAWTRRSLPRCGDASMRDSHM